MLVWLGLVRNLFGLPLRCAGRLPAACFCCSDRLADGDDQRLLRSGTVKATKPVACRRPTTAAGARPTGARLDPPILRIRSWVYPAARSPWWVSTTRRASVRFTTVPRKQSLTSPSRQRSEQPKKHASGYTDGPFQRQSTDFLLGPSQTSIFSSPRLMERLLVWNPAGCDPAVTVVKTPTGLATRA